MLELINVGAVENDGTGDALRVALQKVNAAFSTIGAFLDAIGGTDLDGRLDGLADAVRDKLAAADLPARLAGVPLAVASAASVDLGALAATVVEVTGAERVTAFGAVPNRLRVLRFAGGTTLAHDPLRLILPGAADLVTAPGDTALAVSDAGGVWTVRAYQRANGLPLGVRRGQLLRAVSQTLPGGLAAFLDSGAIAASPDDPTNLAYYHEPFALPGGVLAVLLTTYCRTALGLSVPAATAQVAALFALAPTLSSGT